MIIGKVIGSLVSTIKHTSFDGKKIMLVHPLDKDLNKNGNTIVAIDTVQAGEGDIVIIASEGKSATEILKFKERVPIRSIIIGIVDKIEKA